MRASPGDGEAFLRSNILYDSDDCLLWPFGDDGKGYGAVTIGGVRKRASTWMCTLAHGERPTLDHEGAHSCGRGHFGCVSPRHLRWATRKENEADKETHGTTLRGELNTNSRLCAADVSAIRSDGRILRLIAADFGVSLQSVWSIRNRKTWKHLA